MQVKFFSIVMTFIIMGFVFDLIRRQKMTFKYAVTWLGGCAVVLFFAVNDGLLLKISRMAGFTLPSNFVFFMLLVFVMYLSLLLTIYMNEQNSRAEALAQSIAALEHRLEKTEKKK